MLSDGGYGAIMTILATIILKVFKLEESTKKFMKLMVYCGISTMFWGLLFGGWFGIPNIPAVWFNPTEDPELLLSFSLLFGPSTYMSVLEFGLQTLSRIKIP